VPDICGILLAAGRGQRFGSQPGKLLAPLADGTPIGVAAARTMLAALDTLYAVIAPGDDALADALAATGVQLVINPHAERGMGASLACGVAATGGAQGWLVGLADMPWIQPTTTAAVVAALRDRATLVAPAYRGRRGHPVGFGAAWRESLLRLDTDSGARGLLDCHDARLQLIEVDDPGILHDVDTQEDLQQAVARGS